MKLTYKVGKGDNLSKVADKYNVSVDDLKTWNGINENNKLIRGQKLVLYKEKKEHRRLSAGQSIHLSLPVSSWNIIKGYVSYGDSKNFGLLCHVIGNNSVRPASSGTVVKISQLRGYGKYILIDHGNGWHSMYSNLNDVNVKSGQYVNLSETIGSVKNKKLFFLLAYNGKPVNPTGYFKATAGD